MLIRPGFNRILIKLRWIQPHTSIQPWCFGLFGQVVAAALDAAFKRRQRMTSPSVVLQTPVSQRSGSKRSLKKGDGDTMPTDSTTAGASSQEKVTPDPKHIRTGQQHDDELPVPRSLEFPPPDEVDATMVDPPSGTYSFFEQEHGLLHV